MNRRHEKTKQRILNGFNAAAAKHDFQRITVDEIVQNAGISRATFYRYFKDKYDVMNYNYTDLLTRSLSRHAFTSMEELFAELLKEGREQWNDRLQLFATSGPNSLTEYISSYSYLIARNIFETGNMYGTGERFRTVSRRQDIQIQVFCDGVAAFFAKWVKGQFDMSPEVAASILYGILPEDFRGNLWKRKETDEDR